jgi:hypothetical protein
MISKFIAKKGLVIDIESGYKHVAKVFKIGVEEIQNEMNAGLNYKYEDFLKIFCKAVFKDSLIQLLHEIEKDNAKDGKNMSLSLKISNY